MAADPTTAAIAEQIADRERLQGEITRLARALVEAYTANEVLTAERERLRGLVEEACGLLDDAVQLRDDCAGWFARIAKIRQAAGIGDA